MNLPTQARVVIVGGGIAGCSTAYHLAKLGITDVLLLEQGQLTSGTTWHAAGLVGQMRPNRNMTRMSKYGIELYATLEAETGLATGWKQCGSVNVARTPERMQVLQQAGGAGAQLRRRVQVITPREAGELLPAACAPTTCRARIWLPGDGKANPADLCMSLAKGARNRGVKIVEGIEVTGVLVEQRPRRPACARAQGEVRCEVAGQLRRPVGAAVRRAGRRERAAVFGRALLHRHRPHRRRAPDAAGDARPRRLHLLQGRGRRPGDGRLRAEGQAVDGGPDPAALPVPAAGRGLGPVRAADDQRHPPHALPGDGRDQDAAQRAGELHARRQLHPGRGAGAARLLRLRRLQLGRHRQLRRRRPADGRMDRRRRGAAATCGTWTSAASAPSPANRKALAERTGETLGLHYAMRWPRQELETARPLRTSPLYDLLAAKGAEFGSKNGWERANYFRPAGARAAPAHTLGPPGLAALGDRGAAGHARGGGAVRPELASPSCCCRAAMRWPCCSACAPTRWTCRSAAWSTPRCSTSAAASRAT